MKFKSTIFWIIPITICLLYLDKYLQLDKNLNTSFDEGFYYLSIWKVRHGINNEGLSLWTLILNATISKNISSSVLNLRYISFFLQVVTIVLFSFISSIYLFKKEILDNSVKKYLYFCLVFWLGYSTLGGGIITYNELQSFLLSLMIGLFLLASVYQNSKEFIFCFLIGFLSFLSFVILPPSSVLVSIGILLLLWIRYFNQKKRVILLYSVFIFGFIISALCIHFLILDLNVVIKNMFISAHKLSNLNKGYDIISLLIKLSFYFRDFFIITCLLLGISFLYSIFYENINKGIAIFFLFGSIIIFVIYQKKPVMSLSTIWAFPFILFILLKIKTKSICLISSFLNFNVLIRVFLFIFPLISAFGTNTDLNGKMILFILPWSLLFAELYNNIRINKEDQMLKWILISCLLIMVFQPIKVIISNFKNNPTNYYFNEYKPISGMILNVSQFQYFNRINKILKTYNYKANQDVFFSTTFDHMTICTFEAVPCETFQLPIDFIAEKNKNSLLKPDFIFLNKYDYDMMSDSIKILNWGFPENYDKYFVGTPDPVCIWDNQRWLYCLKNKKTDCNFIR